MSKIAPAALLALLGFVLAAQDGERVLHRERSAYNNIIVTENGAGRRVLLFEEGGDEQSVIQIGAPAKLVLAYTRAAMSALALLERPKRVLMIGLGGGTMATFLRRAYPDMELDCVDIDPSVVKVARRYFFFTPDPKLRVHVADGRRFVEKSSKRYDLILLDAYGADDIPLHLATVEFLRAVRSRLAPGGVVAANVIDAELNMRYGRMLSTYLAVFDEVYQVPARFNRILLALPREAKLKRSTVVKRVEKLQRDKDFGFDLAAVVRKGFGRAKSPGPDVKPLRDAELSPDAP